MASLKRPEACSCGSVNMLKEKNPERYVCLDCKIVMTQRGSKPDATRCRECGVKRGEVPFKDKKNLCMPCYKILMKQYSIENYDRLREQNKLYYQQNHEWLRKRANNYYQANVEVYLKNLLRRTVLCSKKRDGGRRRDLGHDIDFEYLMELYRTQNGKCALSGLEMTHKWNSPYSISCDRIDSSCGYIRGNVQLVCKWVNLGKHKFTNDDIKAVFDDYYSLRKSQESI
jgi:hypothetical protein